MLGLHPNHPPTQTCTNHSAHHRSISVMSDSRKSDDWFAHILEETPESTTLTVQIYGALFILDCSGDDPYITHVSENVNEVCGVTIEQALHHHLADICEASQWVGLIRQAQEKQLGHDNDLYASARVTLVSNELMWMVLHAKFSAVVCEFIPVVEDALNDDSFLESSLQRLYQLLTPQTDSIFRVAQVATTFINETLGFDRCVLYRFEPSPGFGEIIAEHISAENQRRLVPFLGLRFPPQKFTQPMIELYCKVKVRILAEVYDSTSLIVSKKNLRARVSSISPLELPVGGDVEQAQDLLLHSVLRGATTAHEEQLIAMNIRNCMTALVVTGEQLPWGAIQCININIKSYSWSHRMFLARAVDLLSKFISDTLVNVEKQELALLRRNCRQVALIDARLQHECFLVEPLLNSVPGLFDILQGELGVVCISDDAVFRVGRSPSVQVVQPLCDAWYDGPPMDVTRLKGVLPFINSVQWPTSVAARLLRTLALAHEDTAVTRYLCWESSTGEAPPHPLIDTKSWDCVLGVLCKITAAGATTRRIGLLFFREKLDDIGRVSQTVSSAILTNSLVAETMERYTVRWGRTNSVLPGRWGFRQRVIFQLLASLLQEKAGRSDPLHHDHHLDSLRSMMSPSVRTMSRLILNDGNAQAVFRKSTRADQVVYFCLNTNTEFTSIFGSLSALSARDEKDEADDDRDPFEPEPVDLERWLGGIGLELSSVCVDGQLVVKQQSLWSKTKGHLRATLMCRFLYGVHNDGQTVDELYCLEVRDDTMSHRVESALIYAHEHLERAERLKQDLVGTVSHELRTPLTAILGFHEVLYKDLKERDCLTVDSQQSLDYISSAAVHLMDTVTNLLDLSRYEMTSTKRSRVDLITVVQEACRWVQTTAGKRGVKVQLAVLTSSPSATTSSSDPSAEPSPRSNRQHSALGLQSGESTHDDDDDGQQPDHRETDEKKKAIKFSSHVLSGLELDDGFLREPSMNVYGDIVALKRVFVNLLDNAIKFSPSGTTVSVSIRWIRAISLMDQPGFVNVVVEDQGIGIAAENLANIFRPFFQVDLSGVREQKGVGLGLSLVRQLIDLHKGRISVRSKLGRGTRFDITLPAYHSDAPLEQQRMLNMSVPSLLETDQHPLLGPPNAEQAFPVRESEVQPYIMPPLRSSPLEIATPLLVPRRITRVQSNVPASFNSTTCIMVVDDNSINRRLLHRMLSTLGFSNVVECENGQDALDTVDSLVIDSSQQGVSLIFLDIQMPVLDGPSTARALREKRHNFPIVAFSASDWKEDSDTTVSLFDAFLPKPISTAVLTEILEKFIKR